MKLTIFTPAYNRAAFLPRLYDSLLQQEADDFEWLIVDDGSKDDTAAVVARMDAEGKLPIRYVRKENGGKHTAHNLAVDRAMGEWFLCVDSDDWLNRDAVARIYEALEQLPAKAIGLAGYKEDQCGRRLCGDLKLGDTYGLYSMMKQGGWGEYALLFRTSVLREFPFPVIAGERFVTESVLYDRMEQAGYVVSALNAVLEVCEYQSGGLSSSPYRLMLSNPVGYQIYHGQRIDLVRSLKERIGHCIRYQAFRRMKRDDHYRYAGPHRGLTALMWLPGVVGAMYYKSKAKQKESRRMEQ